MGKWVHRIVNKNEKLNKADCSACGKDVEMRFRAGALRCLASARMRGSQEQRDRWVYRKYFYRSIGHIYSCARCKKKSKDFRFFDINHIDSNHQNNDQNNLEQICPSCHRIETLRMWDEKLTKTKIVLNKL